MLEVSLTHSCSYRTVPIGVIAAKHAVDDAMGNYDDAKKLLDKALDFYKEYTGAKNGAVSAAIHRA